MTEKLKLGIKGSRREFVPIEGATFTRADWASKGSMLFAVGLLFAEGQEKLLSVFDGEKDVTYNYIGPWGEGGG